MRDVDASASDVCLLVQITDFIDRAAVNSHAHPKLRMTLELLANLNRALHRRFGTRAKNERAAIAGRQTQQLPFRFRGPELLGSAHDFP